MVLYVTEILLSILMIAK